LKGDVMSTANVVSLNDRVEAKVFGNLVVSPANFHKAGLKAKRDTYIWRGKRYLRISAVKILNTFRKS